MKRIKTTAILVLMAAAMATVGSCSNDEEPATNRFPQDGVVRLTVGVNNALTRASHKADGSSVTEFGVSILNAGATEYTYNNVRVTGSNADGWTPGETMLWQNATQAVDIVAYAPYRDTENEDAAYDTQTTDMPVSVEAVQSADSYASDFLVCKRSGFVPQTDLTDGHLAVAFSHAMSQLTVKIRFGTELNADGAPLAANPIDEGSLQVLGTVTSGTCDFTRASAFVTPLAGVSTSPVTAYESVPFVAATDAKDNATAEYRCILVPQTVVSGFSIAFSIDGEFYGWTASEAVTLSAGVSYELSLNVGRDVVTVGGITVTEWIGNGKSSGTLTTE